MNGILSAVVLSKNDELRIERCLRSLHWCDEIVVIDDFSTDATVHKAKKYTSQVWSHALDADFSQQRNFGLEKARGDWVLFVDSDEEITLSLQYELTHIVNNQFSEYDGYYIRRIDEMWGKKILHGESGHTKLLRFAKKQKGAWVGSVHEVWKVNGKLSQLHNPLLHYPHPTVRIFLEEINFYSQLRARELYTKNHAVHPWDIVLYPNMKFLYTYIWQAGFLDGVAGLVIALMMSFHSFLVRGTLWTMYHHEQSS